MPPVTRRVFLRSSLVGLAGLAGYGGFVEPERIEVRREPVAAKQPTGDVLRVVQLSDLHLRGIRHRDEEVARLVNGLRPGLVLVTGDTCTPAAELQRLPALLAMIDRSVPVYGVMGNWEYFVGIDRDELDEVFRGHGGRLLVNESVRLRHRGSEFLLTGLDDLQGGKPDLQRSVRGMAPAGNHLVMVHCPGARKLVLRQLPAIPEHRPTFMIAGHTHGGQITLCGLAPYIPRGSGGYKYGWYNDHGGPPMFVSRGIGMTSIPIRVMAPPEIVCYDWELEREKRREA